MWPSYISLLVLIQKSSTGVAQAITDILTCYNSAVLSGNQVLKDGSIHWSRDNSLASPPMVVAYALAGNTNVDLTSEPLSYDPRAACLFDGWCPEHDGCRLCSKICDTPAFWKDMPMCLMTMKWRSGATTSSQNYQWNQASTYIQITLLWWLLGWFSYSATENLAVLAKFGDTVRQTISPSRKYCRL